MLRHFLIIQKLRQFGEATFDEILEYLYEESELFDDEDFYISKRTFDRDRDAIRSILNIDISYDRKSDIYRLDCQPYKEINQHLLEAFDLFITLNVNPDLDQIIQIEKRKPTGVENMYKLIHATNNHLSITFSYKEFWDIEPTNRVMEPYGIKEFKGRWYVIGKEKEESQIKTFGLDRMKELEVNTIDFLPPTDFDINTYFRDCYGIFNPEEEEAEHVSLIFTPEKAKYLKAHPLHPSQHIIHDNHEEFYIMLKVKITYDLLSELLSYGDSLTVVAPAKLRDLVVESLTSTLKNYE